MPALNFKLPYSGIDLLRSRNFTAAILTNMERVFSVHNTMFYLSFAIFWNPPIMKKVKKFGYGLLYLFGITHNPKNNNPKIFGGIPPLRVAVDKIDFFLKDAFI